MASNRLWYAAMRDSIRRSVHKRVISNRDLSFITMDKLRRLWEQARQPPNYFQDMQDAIGVQFDEETFLRFIKVISIFVRIDYDNWNFVGRLVRDGYGDENLPFDLDFLERICAQYDTESYFAVDFVNVQYAFCPVVIERGIDLPVPDRQMRFPFLDEVELGAGAYGAVTKVVIAKGYFRRRENGQDVDSNTTVTVARKRFHTATHGQDEQDVLNRLRRNPLNHERIMSSFASVNLGRWNECEYNLFFKYAPADLFKFMHGDIEYLENELHIKLEDITPQALFDELRYLTSAIAFLHQEDIRVCHSDLKLDNILIILSDHRHPIGKWTITDFGIASIEPRPRSEAVVVRDLMVPPTSMSVRSSGIVTVHDQRLPGPYQPPEVEFEDLRPPGRYRAKGDVWSLGCIAISVLVYAIGGNPLIEEMEGILKSPSRDGRRGFFYEGRSSADVAPYSEMVDWILKIATRWDTWAEHQPHWDGWIMGAWKRILVPMIMVRVEHRTDAQPHLVVLERYVRRFLPSQNMWQAFRSQTSSISRPSNQPNISQPPLTRSVIRRRPVPTHNQTASSGSPMFTRIREAVRNSYHEPGRLRPSSVVPIQESSEETGSTTSPPSSRSGSQPSAPPLSPIHHQRSPNGSIAPANIKSLMSKKCQSMQITEDGMKIFLLEEEHGLRSLLRDPSGSWRLHSENPLGDEDNIAWSSSWLAGPYLLLRKKADRQSHTRLQNISSTTHNYQQVWDNAWVPGLASASLIAVSSKGHIAFRRNDTNIFAVYSRHAEKLFEWDLHKVEYPRKHNDHEGIEAMGFDPDGDYLIVTAWNCWFRWTLASDRDTPSRFGHHEYTPRDAYLSKRTLQVFPGGRYFLLHDQYHQEEFMCADVLRCTIRTFKFEKRPKPDTIVISRNCDWLAYIVESGRSRLKDTLYYCQVINGEPDSDTMPTMGATQELKLKEIETVKSTRRSAPDAVIRIISSNNTAYALIVSIMRYIEIYPLYILPTERVRS